MLLPVIIYDYFFHIAQISGIIDTQLFKMKINLRNAINHNNTKPMYVFFQLLDIKHEI